MAVFSFEISDRMINGMVHPNNIVLHIEDGLTDISIYMNEEDLEQLEELLIEFKKSTRT